MESTWFQVGSTITTLQSQVQQLAQAIQEQTRQHQETRDLIEALAKSEGKEWSQDLKAWVKKSAMATLRDSVKAG